MNNSTFFGRHILSIIIALAATVYSVTAYHSDGFYHADEHYQLIEFAGLKLGTNTAAELAWEYKAEMRPTLQPAICFAIFKFLNTIHITDPYHQAFVLRLLSAFLAIFIITFFIKSTKRFVGQGQLLPYYLLSFFLWFIPAISVRFSSETWGGLALLLAVAIFLSQGHQKAKYILVGLVLGISFFIRFQMGFAIAGFGLWMLFFGEVKKRELVALIIGFFMITALGTVLDAWFYSKLVFTPWNYFNVNILQGAAAGFGSAPWYYYLANLFSAPSYVLGIPIFICSVGLLVFNPKSFVLWLVIPFFIGHTFVSHKEVRFLFPIVYFFPFIVIYGYGFLCKYLTDKRSQSLIKYFLLPVFIVVNAIGLLAMSQKSAGTGRATITKYIHRNYGEQKIHLIFCTWSNPYNPWQNIPLKFYLEKSITTHKIDKLCELHDSLLLPGAVNLLVLRKLNKENTDCLKILKDSHYRLKKQSVPNWIESINQYYGGFKNEHITELYKYSPKAVD